MILACTNGNGYRVSSADGSVLDSGNNSLNMVGLKATLSLTNIPPVAEDNAYTTDEDTAFTTGDVLTNDLNVEGPVFFDRYDDSGLLGLLSYSGYLPLLCQRWRIEFKRDPRYSQRDGKAQDLSSTYPAAVVTQWCWDGRIAFGEWVGPTRL